MIVITGPTGSGKTTTLATMLSILNEPTRKILTIEDPVEYEIPGINQSQVKPSIGLTFATALRAFVRQDPDVIMVGEIRDAETAHIAIHAALTGHLVLTTLHTETAAAAVPRLLDLGVEGFLLKSTLRAVIAQRLVRMLCDRCKTQHTLDGRPTSRAIRAMPCSASRPATWCTRPAAASVAAAPAIRGRNGVFEVLEMSDEVRKLIGPQTDSAHHRPGRDHGRHDDHAGRMRSPNAAPASPPCPRCSASRRCGEPMPSYRYRALNGNGELVSGAIAASRAGEVAQRIETSGLVLVETSRSRRAAARRAAVFSIFNQPTRRRRHGLHPRPRAVAARRRARSMTAWNCWPPTATSAGCGRSWPRSARTSSPARVLPKRCRGTTGIVSADVCGADPGRRGVGVAGSGARSAGRRAQRRRGAAAQGGRRHPLSAVRARRGRLRADVLSHFRAAAIRLRAAAISAPRSIRSWRRSCRFRPSCAPISTLGIGRRWRCHRRSWLLLRRPARPPRHR